MTKTQKSIITVLTLVACSLAALVGYYGFQAYDFYVNKPLGAAPPPMTFLPLPATWTPRPGSQNGSVTLAPTVSFATPTPAPICNGSGTMNVLVVGTDSRVDSYQYGLGDAIRVVRIDFSNRKVTVLEFPRDLWVKIPYIADNLNGQDHEKLNQAFLYGQPGDGFHYWDDPSQGSGLLALTLNINFGVVIDHYIAVNMRTFVNVVNALNGIDVTIPNEDWALNTGLSIGTHHLNGDEALKVARNREDGVFARTSNQNLVLCAVRKKLTNPGVITKIPDLIASFKDNVRTDFTPEQLSQLACLGNNIPPGNISLASFPQELFTQARIYDPVFKKNVFIWKVDFNQLKDYVVRFQAGTWPTPAPSSLLATPQETDSEFTCE